MYWTTLCREWEAAFQDRWSVTGNEIIWWNQILNRKSEEKDRWCISFESLLVVTGFNVSGEKLLWIFFNYYSIQMFNNLALFCFCFFVSLSIGRGGAGGGNGKTVHRLQLLKGNEELTSKFWTYKQLIQAVCYQR